MKHLFKVRQPYFERKELLLGLAVGLAVLDAPVVAAEMSADGETSLKLVPWVRVFRHEPASAEKDQVRSSGLPTAWAFDVVHKDFLLQYVVVRLLAFAEEAATRIREKATRLFMGSSFDADEIGYEAP